MRDDLREWVDEPESTWAPLGQEAMHRDPRASWREYEAAVERLTAHFDAQHRLRAFDFVQPMHLQSAAPVRLQKPYTTPVAYTDWGPRDAPVVVCLGGVANTAMRFCFLAARLKARHRVICMDWVGRGRSGWLADGAEYVLDTYVEQLRQLLDHLDAGPVDIVGSSMGGTVGISLAAAHPQRVRRLVLNDIGAHMPAERRQRRAETLARFHVFRTPGEMQRRVGAAQKNDGPVSDAVRGFIAYHQTRWSPENGGRIYRADPRAMTAYREQAGAELAQWSEWQRLPCPVMLIHGMESDALLPVTIDRMRRVRPVHLMHVPQTGHTPVLCDVNQIHAIATWLQGDGVGTEFSAPLHATADSP